MTQYVLDTINAEKLNTDYKKVDNEDVRVSFITLMDETGKPIKSEYIPYAVHVGSGFYEPKAVGCRLPGHIFGSFEQSLFNALIPYLDGLTLNIPGKLVCTSPWGQDAECHLEK